MPYYDDPAFRPDEILIYLRKSRSDDPVLTVDEVLARHEAILDEWQDRNLSSRIPEENRFREVVSGETIDGRPELLRLLHLIESPRYKAILCVEAQRLSRGDLEDAGRIIKLLRYTNTYVITPSMTYDVRNEYDRDNFKRELERGNDYLEYTKKIMGRGRHLSVSRGNFIGSIPPYGYDRAILYEGKKRCHTLSVNEDEAAIIRLAVDRYLNYGEGYSTIAHMLNRMGLKTRQGVEWTHVQVRDIISNPHINGKVVWQRRKEVISIEDMQIIRSSIRQPIGSYEVFDGKHDAIIDDDTFARIQARMQSNLRRDKVASIPRNAFAGLLYCQCGKPMVYSKRKKSRLHCARQTECHSISCEYAEIVAMVQDSLRDTISDFELEIRNTDTNRETEEDMLLRLQKKYELLKRREYNQWKKYTEDAMPKEIFDQMNQEIIQEKELTAAAIHDLQEALENHEIIRKKIQSLHDAIYALSNDTIGADKQNRFLKACVRRITYSRFDDSTVGLRQKGFDVCQAPISLDIELRI